MKTGQFKNLIKDTKVLVFFFPFFIFSANVDVANASVVGTSPNLSGQTNIYNTTVWQGETLTLGGQVTIFPGGSLTLDGTSLTFASTAGHYYGIEVRSGTVTPAKNPGVFIVKNNSNVTAQNPGYNTFVFGYSGSKGPIIQVENSTFSKLGKGVYGLNGSDPDDTDNTNRRYGLELLSADSTSYFHNVTVTDSYNGIYMWEGVLNIEISNCTFENIERTAINVRGMGPNIHNNTFNNIFMGVYATNTNGMRIIDNNFNAGSQNNGSYMIDVMYTDTNFTIKGNTITNFQKGIVLNGVLASGDGPSNGLIENNTLTDGGGCGVGMNMGSHNITIRNNTFQNVLEPIIDNLNYSIKHADLTIEGNNITTTVSKIVKGMTLSSASNFNITNNSFAGFASGYGFQNVKSIRTGGAPSSTGLHVVNTTFSNFANGAHIEDLIDSIFKDVKITTSKTHDIEFYGSNSNIKFINTQFDLAKVYFNTGNTSDIFLPYSYLDARVLDQSGNPISGATITITNEVDNTNYPSINIDGTNKSTFTTDSNGYTPLPSDTANSIAILDYTKTSTTQTEMTYTVTATKNGRTSTVHGINPDATWHRTTPDTRQNTVTLTLDMSVPVYTLTINQGSGSGSYAQNQSVTITANSAPSGQTFDRWTGDTQYLSSTTSSTATVTIPAQAISLTATYKNITTGGTGGTGGSGGGTTSLIPTIIKTEIISITNNQVNLALNVTNAIQMMLSDNSNFTGSTWETYAITKTYTKTDTQTKLYLKFKSSTDTVSSTIELNIPTNTTTTTSTTDPSPYPTGTLLKLSDSFKVYVIIDNKKKWIPTPEVFEQLGYKWTEIKILTEAELNSIPDYEDNLIRAINDYKVYLVVNGVKRHIPNPIIFLDYGFKWEEVKDVPQSTIDKYKPTYLIKQSGSNGIYYVNPQEIRKLIPSTEVFNSYNDKTEDIQIISKTEMDFYPLSNLIKLNGSNDIYLIEGNIKKRIPSPQVFNKYKLNWNLVMSVNQTEFNFYSDGGELR